MFSRAHTQYSLRGLKAFGNIFINLLIEIHNSKEVEFTPDIIFNDCGEDLIPNMSKIDVDLLSSSSKIHEDESDLDDLNPLDKFLVYLYESSSDHSKFCKTYCSVFEKCVLHFSFENLPAKKKKLFNHFNQHLCDNIGAASTSSKNVFEGIKIKSNQKK